MDDIVAARRSSDTCGSAVGCAATTAAAAATAASTVGVHYARLQSSLQPSSAVEHLYISGRLPPKLHDISCDATGFR